MSAVIWWIRRDLRLHDNPTLQEALSSGLAVIPVFILDHTLIHSPNTGEKRLAFLWAGLNELKRDLQARGSQLIIRNGPPVEALKMLVAECDGRLIFAEADYSPYARKRDHQVAQILPLKLVGGSAISHPEALLKANGQPYVVYTPFMRSWKAIQNPASWQFPPAPSQIPSPWNVPCESIPLNPGFPENPYFTPGETAARKRLMSFTTGVQPGIYCYARERDRMDLDGTALLSAYLRFGMLSAREAAAAAFHAQQSAPDKESQVGCETWLNELIWREFYISILYHFPWVLKHSFREELRTIPWQNDTDDFDAWCQGRTGYPVVDAAMRQLTATGWMHNRARMIAASFLVKDLLIDWRWGERWFMQHLIDGDLAANNGGWQWTAGTGTDAAPYFRIFNPILQSKKFNPQGEYIRKWVAELNSMPSKYIHAPWEFPSDGQKDIGCIIGQDYPVPIIDHAYARQRTLQVYQTTRNIKPD